MFDRRTFLAAGAAAVAAGGTRTASADDHESSRATFSLDYAPHFGSFAKTAGSDLIDQLRFMHDNGFRSLEDNPFTKRSFDDQKNIAAEMERLGMRMGVFVANWPVRPYFQEPLLASGDKATRDAFVKVIADSVEIAKRANAKWATVVPGCLDPKLPMPFQTANVVDALRRAAEIYEKHGLVMVLEPLNHWTNHPRLFLSGGPQAYAVCKAVDSPACKILFDIYHQQITEGNLIANMRSCWSEIGYIQVGDNPGRKEPGTGEINYKNVFRFLKHEMKYDGIIGMEHGQSKPGPEGELAVLRSYIEHDAAVTSDGEA